MGKNDDKTKTKLNEDYIVMKKTEMYALDKDGQRHRIWIEFPITMDEEDVQDILSAQSKNLVKLDGVAPGSVATITISQRTK